MSEPERDTPDAYEGEPADVQASRLEIPVVGIGASAGGLSALTRFFEQMPDDVDMAFVVILHLSPRHESHAAEILQRATRLRVQQVEDTVAIAPNHVYVIPPNRQLQMSDGHLRLAPAARREGRLVTVDAFFRTLARAHASRAFGIVLSGTGADGAVGMGRIKEMGGVTFAQSPADAEHDGMPQAAIDTGAVDFVLPVAEIPRKLLDLAANARRIRLPPQAPLPPGVAAAPDDEDDLADRRALREIMTVLRARTQHDFRHYKRATVLRRIERRMQVNGTPRLTAYREHLLEHPQETQHLLQDMLISVTQFFRDRPAFEALEREVLPPLAADLSPGQTLRAWSVGCATGEEAFSVAMLLQDALDQAGHEPSQCQVFGSDIDDRALRTARTAVYPASIAGDLSPAHLRHYLLAEDERLRVAKSVRDRVVFAHHNLLRDPPFSRLQLVVCRNLLIYLEREAQAVALETFRYALAPDGVLFLGASETPDAVPDLFVPIDARHRLYRVNARRTVSRPSLLLSGPGLQSLAATPPPAVPADVRKLPFADMHLRALQSLSAASILVDADLNILHLSDGAARFMRTPVGVPTLGLVANAHPALRLELRAALFRARQQPAPVVTLPVPLGEEDPQQAVRIAVRLFRDPPTGVETYLVTLDDAQIGTAADPGLPPSDALAQENRRLKEQLQDTLESAEFKTEQLGSANESLQAINEELRSATEELETSKEELQSANEELTTVNYELASKVDETSRINDDLQNLIAATDIATVFIDPSMRVKRYTPRAGRLFNFIMGDIGRSLGDITHRLDYDDMLEDAHRVFEQLQPLEREVASHDGGAFMARLAPYRTLDDKIEGVVMTFVDVSARRQAEDEALRQEERLRIAVESTKDFAIMITDEQGVLTDWNTGAERVFGWSAAQAVGQPMSIIFTDEDRADGVPARELRTAAELGRAEDERWHRRRDGSVFYCSGVVTPFAYGERRGFSKIARDVTGLKRAEQAREAALEREQDVRRRAEAAMELKEEFLAVMSHELKHPLNLIALNAALLMRLPQVREIEQAVRAAQTIQRTVAAQAKIVDDLLDLSRARTGKLALQLVPIDWAAVVGAIVDAVQVDAQAKGVTLSLAGAQAPLRSLFDRTRAEQIVWNLLSNALKFTPSGGAIDVVLSQENGLVRLTVTDTGKGIAPDFVERIFDMFSQELGPQRRQEGGLGVGLALVRELVTAHGGRVSARSEGLGRGASFDVWVPLDPTAVDTGPSTAPAGVLKDLRLLVVDDSADTLTPLLALLQLYGAAVVGADNGHEALRLISGAPFDVLLSDISMPDMTGFELIRAVRSSPLPHQPLAVACSGYAREQDAERALAAGFDAVLSKPFSIDELQRVLQAHRRD